MEYHPRHLFAAAELEGTLQAACQQLLPVLREPPVSERNPFISLGSEGGIIAPI